MQSYQTLAERPRQSLMLSVPLGRRRGPSNPGGAKLWQTLGFQAGQTLYLALVSVRHLFEIRDSRGKQIDIETVNRTCEKTKN
jgi:hypothetical protein